MPVPGTGQLQSLKKLVLQTPVALSCHIECRGGAAHQGCMLQHARVLFARSMECICHHSLPRAPTPCMRAEKSRVSRTVSSGLHEGTGWLVIVGS